MTEPLLILTQIEWQQAYYLLLALQPLLLWVLIYGLQRKQQHRFADPHLLPWVHVNQQKSIWQRVFSRNTAYSLAWVLFAIALAGPRVADNPENNQGNLSLDVMIVVDLSRSMYADDIQPSRIRRANLEIHEFLSLSKNTKIGVIVYAARPHVFVPLSNDKDALKFYLKNLDSLQLPTKGSDASAALTLARQELLANKQDRKQVILWLSDGDIDPNDSDKLKAEAQKTSKNHIRIYTMGLATAEGVAIPQPDGTWLEHEGKGVISSLNSELLKTISEHSNGRFAEVRDDESDWQILYNQGMLTGISNPVDASQKHWKLLYMWFLLPAILLLLIALFPFSLRSLKHVSSTVIIVCSVLIISAMPTSLYATENTYRTSVLEGIQAYQDQEQSKAKSKFIKAVLIAKTDDERAIALHNLGNALFQIGDYANASVLFDDALRYAPKQQQSLTNRKLSTTLNDILEKRRKKAQAKRLNNSSMLGEQLMDLPENLPAMLNTKAVDTAEFTLPKLPTEKWQHLLNKGIAHLRLLNSDDGEKSQREQLHQQNIQQAKLYLLNLEEKPSNALWKRLFEIEEGFPGDVKEPKDVPGIRAW